MSEFDDPQPGDTMPMAGTCILAFAAISTLLVFWMLRSGSVPLAAWPTVAVIWTCGTVVTVLEKVSAQ